MGFKSSGRGSDGSVKRQLSSSQRAGDWRRRESLGSACGVFETEGFGYAAEVWSRQALAKHIREHAVEVGYPALSRAAKATVQRILAEQPLHPEKVKYYLERRDPDFEAGMRKVLIVYQDVELQNAKRAAGQTPSHVITVSVDEKPGVQAIGNTAPDLPPVPGKHPKIGRDHEYKRFGTCSILAALDLQDGHVTARVEDRHRSIEFIGLLSDLDRKYPPECTIRIIFGHIPVLNNLFRPVFHSPTH